MDLLKPPTDNLYKFLALSGVALIIASLILNDRINEIWSPVALDAVKQHRIASEEYHDLLNKILTAEEFAAWQKTTQQPVGMSGESPFENYLSDSIREIGSQYDYMSQLAVKHPEVVELRRKWVDADVALALAQFTWNQGKAKGKYVLTALFMGIALAVVGFGGWVPIQRLQDTTQRKQSELLALEIEGAKQKLRNPS